MGDGRLEDIGLFIVALGREIAAGAGGAIDRLLAGAVRRGEGREGREAASLELAAPFLYGEIELVRSAAAYNWNRPARRHRRFARVVIIGDLRQPLGGGLFHQRIEQQRRSPT